MGSESLTTALHGRSQYYPTGQNHDNRSRRESAASRAATGGDRDGDHDRDTDTDGAIEASANAHDSWSIKRLLSRHVSRRYRVLEKEPNRLRKRSTR